jgi:small conductance mechanosensitive channel
MALDQEVTLVNKYFEKIIDFGFEYVPKLRNYRPCNWTMDHKINHKGIRKSLVKSNIDQSLVPFLKSLTNIILKALATVMGMIEIQMTSFVAIIEPQV